MGDGVRTHQRLGTRLGVAFALTALAAVAIATGLAWLTTGDDLDRLVVEQRDRVSRDVVAALAAAHEIAGGWDEAELLPAHTLAASAGAVLVVTTPAGRLPEPPGVAELQQQLRQQGPVSEPEPESGSASEDGEADGRGSEGEGSDDGGADDGGPDDEGPDAGGRATQSPSRPPGDSPRSGPRGASSSRDQQRAVAVRLASVPADVESVVEDAVEVEEERSLPVVVDDEVVGTATLLFVRQGSPDPIATLRAALRRNLLVAGGSRPSSGSSSRRG